MQDIEYTKQGDTQWAHKNTNKNSKDNIKVEERSTEDALGLSITQRKKQDVPQE
jgi:hypothetical protein